MPLHKGHEAMIRFGMAQCETFTVLVCALPTEPIAGPLRLAWMKELFPTAQVAYLDDPTIPQEPKDHPDFWNLWRTAMQALVPEPIDAVFASEAYGFRLAEELNAVFVPFDVERVTVPTSGTTVRTDPFAEWEYLTAPVRRQYLKRVVILGPESVGKTTLTKQLAEHFSTKAVHEYARPLFDTLVANGKRQPGEFRYEDLDFVARGQAALEATMVESAHKILFCDTDVITTVTWSQYLYGKHEDWMVELAKEGKYDLTIVLSPEDNRFVQDGGRVMGGDGVREKFFAQLCKNLESIGREYVVVRGTHKERLDTCIALSEALLTPSPAHLTGIST